MIKSKRQKVGIVGVTGYTGMELLRIIEVHPRLELSVATSRSEAGKRIADVLPCFQHTEVGEVLITAPDAADIAEKCQLAFLAVPHSAAMEVAAELLDKKTKVVDLSADFRLRDPVVYEEWYNHKHSKPGYLSRAVYGLPEIYASLIAQTSLVANPGCYPTSAILGLYPALANNLVRTEGIVIDSKSGTSGAGKKAIMATAFCESHDNFRAYSLAGHRHTPEIEQELSSVAGREVIVSFNPHILPINRGILSTIYTSVKKGKANENFLEYVHSVYRETYRNNHWIRVLPMKRLPETRWVRGSMFCDIGLVTDERTNRLIIVSAIDNLCRGASGQAVACANLMLGFSVDEGLDNAAFMP